MMKGRLAQKLLYGLTDTQPDPADSCIWQWC